MKILILSLGTGAQNKEVDITEELEKLKKGEYNYRPAYYRMDNHVYLKCPFVADALIDQYQPDRILMIGTVRSMWGEFYHRFCKEEETAFDENWIALKECSKRLDKNTEDEEIKKFQKTIDEIYEDRLSFRAKIKTCIIKYGLNEKELRENYKTIGEALRAIINDTEKEEKIEIAFDITHSFRSLPIYNLVVIDYCRMLMQRDIEVSHVYYGNLDVSSENDKVGEILDNRSFIIHGDKEKLSDKDKENGIAEIVDLKEIVDILEATRGISEFINTGNATTFLGQEEKRAERAEDDGFNEALRNFHGGMQMSDRRTIQDALEKLFGIAIQGDENALLDAKVTIREILKREIHIPDNINAQKKGVELQKEIALFQLNLAKWCLNNGQVGIAAAIAKEAFRSFLVAVFEKDPKQYEDENRRKRAEQCFGNVINEKEGIEEFRKYDSIESEAREIRNIYAHNLKVEEMTGKKRYRYEEAKRIVGEYIDAIESIMKLKDSVFMEKTPEAELQSQKKKKIVLLITNEEDKETLELYCRKLGKEGKTVYRLAGEKIQIKGGKPKDIKNEIKGISRIIALKINKLIEEIEPDKNMDLVWGKDMDAYLAEKASELITSFILNISKANVICHKINERNKQYPIDCFWRIDANELNEEKAEKAEVHLAAYRWEELCQSLSI